MSLLPSLARAPSSLPTLRRSIRHIARDPNTPKFRANLHPQGWVSPTTSSLTSSSPSSSSSSPTQRPPHLPSPALFSYNPPPTVPTPSTTLPALDPIVSATGKTLPTGWKRVPGYGHLAPRVDRREEGDKGLLAGGGHWVVPEETKEEIRRLRVGDPEVWTCAVLGKKFSLPPFFIARLAPLPPALVQRIEQDRQLRLERIPLRRVVREEARKIQRSFW